MSRIEQRVVTAWADILSASIVNRVIDGFQGMEATLSGADSGLRSVWEEICAQVQGEESCDWSVYEDLLNDSVYACVEDLDCDARLALWAVTDEGWSYIYEHHADQDGADAVSVDTGDIVTKLTGEVLSAAADFESPSLFRYLWEADDPEVGDGEDEDEEEDNS